MIQAALLGVATLLLGACASAPPSPCPVIGKEPLRLEGKTRELTLQTPQGPLRVQRWRTACAASDGALQPLVPLPGVKPAVEIDVLHALADPQTLVIDMRDIDEPIAATLPNSYHIPYNEVEDRMDEVGCSKRGRNQWDCSAAPHVLVFCHGPMCLQSPAGIRAMVQAGFPVERISYYRGGMLDWQALGLPTVSGNLPPRKTGATP
ncbi:MAG: hypothetical protein OHK0048_01440 [Rhodoferax sp.]